MNRPIIEKSTLIPIYYLFRSLASQSNGLLITCIRKTMVH